MASDRLLLVGCGILQAEIRLLIEKNHWPLDAVFLDSALHVDFHKLGEGLTVSLDRHAGRRIVVLYGACHPRIDDMLCERALSRIPVQNCIEMLVGHSVFTDEIAKGAYFLLEDWARNWDRIVSESLGTNPQIVRGVFRNDRRYVLALRTPCSGDFTAEAERIAAQVGLPLQSMTVSLAHLERLLQEAIDRDAKGEENA